MIFYHKLKHSYLRLMKFIIAVTAPKSCIIIISKVDRYVFCILKIVFIHPRVILGKTESISPPTINTGEKRIDCKQKYSSYDSWLLKLNKSIFTAKLAQKKIVIKIIGIYFFIGAKYLSDKGVVLGYHWLLFPDSLIPELLIRRARKWIFGWDRKSA